MACCGGDYYDEDDEIPSCSDIKHPDANGHMEMKMVKCRAKLFKSSVWCLRYCVLHDGKLFVYVHPKGKSDDPGTFVINLHGASKVSVRTYSAQKEDQSMAKVGCEMAITDKYKRKHKLRCQSGDEQLYWSSRLANATGIALADFAVKGKKVTQYKAKRYYVKDDEKVGCDDSESQEVDEGNSETDGQIAAELGADELAQKRRNAKDYLKWLHQRDSMLERRERDLCTKIESSLPSRANSATSKKDVMANNALPSESESSVEKETQMMETKCELVEKADDRALQSESPISDPPPPTPPPNTTLVEMPHQPPDDANEPSKPEREQLSAVKNDRQLDKDTREFPALLAPPETTPPTVPKSPQRVSTLPPLTMWKGVESKRRPSALVAKMHEMFSAKQSSPPCPNFVNLRSLMGATGTVQFPSYRRIHPSQQCHKSVTNPKPKWWTNANGVSRVRFKCDRSSNPVWRMWQEKSESGVNQ